MTRSEGRARMGMATATDRQSSVPARVKTDAIGAVSKSVSSMGGSRAGIGGGFQPSPA